MQCWKSFTIADAIISIKGVTNELKPETINAYLKNLGNEVVSDFKGFLEIDGEVRKIIHTARHVGGEGFTKMLDEEVKEHI